MVIGTYIIVIFILIIIIISFSDKRKIKNKNIDCYLDKLLIPFGFIARMWQSNNTINVEYLWRDAITLNTVYKNLYGIEASDYSKLTENVIYELFEKFSKNKKGFFYKIILKDDDYQKQYIFSYSKELIDYIALNINVKILTGEKLIRILKKLTYIHKGVDKRDIKETIVRNEKHLVSKLEVYQGYKAKNGNLSNIYHELEKIKFKGVLWSYFDFYQGRVLGYKDFNLENQNTYFSANDMVLMNFILISENITKKEVNKISDIYRISLVKKSIDNAEIICKTPLKYRDVGWDLFVDLEYISGHFNKGKED